MTRRARLGVLAMMLGLATAAAGQTLESVLMPGDLIAGHAKLEADCANCHVKFDRVAQDRLCLDCHKPVAADVRAKRSYHGRLPPQACRSCHSDHKGRDAKIAAFDTARFDHRDTGYPLAGAHARAQCTSCHVAGRKYRDTPSECASCHTKDDVHKGTLGRQCADCHDDTRWKTARFDHARTRFALTGKHATTGCRECHRDATFKGAQTTCVSCHRPDDRHKGRLGDRCDTCHTAANWKDIGFDHAHDAHFVLRGRHRDAKCEACHATVPAQLKLPTDCASCHAKDDRHKGSLGNACGDCHTERNWREARVDHDLTRFPLTGKHRNTDCKGCHRDPQSYKNAPLTCIGCHRADDTHKGRYGDRCESCHDARSWKPSTFRHDRDTKYPLLGKHASTACGQCHTGTLYVDKTARDCVSCHRKDDVHKGGSGTRCESCHQESDWKRTSFDHARSRFPLLGGHVRVQCKACHVTPEYRGTPVACVSCHEKDDRHKRTLGRECATCHNARDWRAWDFDHAKTRFALSGAHAKARCTACHDAPVEGPMRLPTACADCHRRDDKHEGRFGTVCERCHTTTRFSEIVGPVRGRGGQEARP
jgi:hypothetical protein